MMSGSTDAKELRLISKVVGYVRFFLAELRARFSGAIAISESGACCVAPHRATFGLRDQIETMVLQHLRSRGRRSGSIALGGLMAR